MRPRLSGPARPRTTRSFGWTFVLLPLLWACGEQGGVVPPEPLFGEVPVKYPLNLWDENIEGELLLRVLVNETGSVDSVEVLEPSGFTGFDDAAVRGAREFRFNPARRGDQRVTAWAQVPVRFSKRPRSDPPP